MSSLLKTSKKKKSKKEKKIDKLRKKQTRYKNRKEKMRKALQNDTAFILFRGDKEKEDEYINFMLREQELASEDSMSSLALMDEEDLKKSLKKLDKNFKIKNFDDCITYMKKKNKIVKKHTTSGMRVKGDLGSISYINPNTRGKKFGSTSDYRKHLQKVVKKEQKEAEKLGYIDCSLEAFDKRMKARGKSTGMEELMLADEFTIKHNI